ncbi:fused MFS/spermidine synthase [Aeromicrobium sp. Leaf350]|uniref:fused MFS/spermidine synthase n=1 Tax=Aeromicrobium sp. Leaf350 TaxID=2876565 RepID=UPI001E4C6DE5|nr:fused MFS/spermidine synthase [Aeromicrobium sp. Leaf350]
MTRFAHTALVLYASAAVLVVELTALRLLAPYFGLSLETSTMVIGLALTAIAVGSWAGGWLADRRPPEQLLAPALALSGITVAVTPAVMRAAAAVDDVTLLLAAMVTIGVPGALLSAVTPIVTTVRLTTLEETGAVVGSLSGISTVGAIAGTVVTGFVLISRVAVSTILIGLGVSLVVLAVVVLVADRRPRAVPPLVLALVAASALTVAARGTCDAETTYHCAVLSADPDDPSLVTLELDGLRHSAVDLDDPTHLEFAYTQALAVVADQVLDSDGADEPRVLHLGAGGMTLPRYLAATRPGTASTVVEVDPGVAELNRTELGPLPDVDLVVDDARLVLDDLAPATFELVIGDAFGGISPPWHLTTREAVVAIEDALVDDGTYVANLIDYGPLSFAKAEVATAASVFEEIVLLAEPETIAGDGGGNLLVVATNGSVDSAALATGLESVGWEVLDDQELRDWYAGAPVLTDDYAPVDQLISAVR